MPCNKPCVREFSRQHLGVLSPRDGDQLGFVVSHLFPQQFEVASGCEGDDLKALGEVSHHGQRRGPDGPRGSKDGDSFHPTRPVSRRYPSTSGAG